ncbi:hypothetical protein FK178_09400 [Antarcticibacterium arcticum]|uniref:Uncharacterized protein n=1 Tax=Antarcticibacterium arcticum TaxID=2585771 RepID=A0A5B8YM92_9FLAO|nr:hypothetical protein [Antarcticibacterium arcticum]QED37927.1 hypothetical protein FK178_09400 [Antarcticibacterium arcticum]
MDKANLLYIMFFINILVMIYTFMNIAKQEDLRGYKKTALIYTTILFPVLGLVCLKIPVGKR